MEKGCERIWVFVVLYHLNLSLYGFNMGTMNGLGMQWVLGRTTLVFTWFLGLPLAYYVSVVRGGGLDALWRWAINTPYFGLNVVLCLSFATANWSEIGEQEVVVLYCKPGIPATFPIRESISPSKQKIGTKELSEI